jgi:hypothetical protein
MSDRSKALASCHGLPVVGTDGPIGEVETPLFPPGGDEPDFLVLRLRGGGRLFPEFRILPAVLVERVEADAVVLRICADAVAYLPTRLPVADPTPREVAGVR